MEIRRDWHGRILATDPVVRFWEKVNKDGPLWNGTACWVWVAYQDGKGYGNFGFGHSKHVKAYRVAYEWAKGSIPKGLELDHLCRNKLCVNPEHMEAVTHAENVRRGLAGKVHNHQLAKIHCPLGHPYDLLNTYYFPDGRRKCRACNRDKEAFKRIERMGGVLLKSV